MRLLSIAILLVLVASGAVAAPLPEPIPAEDGLVVVVIPIDNMPVAQAAEQARLFLSARGVALPDERTRRLIIKDHPENVEKVRAHLKGVDVALPMVSLTVDYGVSSNASESRVGIDGVVVTTSTTVITGGANNTQTTMANTGVMKLVTMSGSEGVISVGEQIPLVAAQYFFDYAYRLGLITSVVGYQDVSTGFGVVPRVLSNEEVVLKIYPRVAYLSPTGPQVIRYFGAATEVRARNGQPVTIASSSQDASALMTRILSTGRRTSGTTGTITVTPKVMRYP